MCREVAVNIENSAVACLVVEVAVDADTVAVALSDHALIFHVDELILQ